MIIGSHVKFNNEQLLASVKEAITYGANTFMFYTGAPQNTKRSAINDMYTLEAYNLMKENNISLENVICHAPYIVNLANRLDESKYRFSKEFLRNELDRCELLNVKYLVLHPGSAVGQEPLTAITNIIDALNDILNVKFNSFANSPTVKDFVKTKTPLLTLFRLENDCFFVVLSMMRYKKET